MFDLVLKDALIVSGKIEPPVRGDIAILGDTIASVGNVDKAQAKRVIDAEGYVVTPGFVDIHCHSDAIAFHPEKNPLRLRQGFTTEVIGNCGIGAAPVNPEYREQLRKYNQPFYAGLPLSYEWCGFGEYLTALDDCEPLLNMAALVGHGALRAAVVGFEDRKLTADEFAKMRDLLSDSLQAGAFGMSTGLIYPPGIYADDMEILEMAKILKAHECVYTTHMRSESAGMLACVEENIRLARQTGVSVEISHHKVHGRRNRGLVKTSLNMIEQANAEGLNVLCDVYPYDAGSTQFSAVLPPWALAGGIDKLLERLENPDARAKIIADIKSENTDFENMYQLAGWEKILINECSVAEYAGKTVAEIADMKGADPFETALDIILESRNSVMMIIFTMDERDVARVLMSPYSMVCTDGFPSLAAYHPRYIGAFIRVLEKYVKQENILSLPEAIYKMTLMPAAKLGILDRGVLEEGKKADILCLDFAALKDNSSYQRYNAPADGVEYVIINGQIAVEQSEFLPVRAGRVLRRQNSR